MPYIRSLFTNLDKATRWGFTLHDILFAYAVRVIQIIHLRSLSSNSVHIIRVLVYKDVIDNYKIFFYQSDL